MLSKEVPGDFLWHSNAQQLALSCLAHASPLVRRAAAQSLVALARLAPALQAPLVLTLEGLLAKPESDCSGALLAAARLRACTSRSNSR
jgi:hypothetical protein